MADTITDKYKEYVESDAVKAAKAALEQQMAAKPGEYQSQWQNSLNQAMDKILNREKFTYDLNGDALYNQYKDQYVKQGNMAMMDTMGQAAALTGGYGNSYAQSVGQQTFQGYLQGLNDKIPELYNLARSAYDSDTAELYNQYGLYADREDQDYGRYRDQLGDWESERDYLTNQYDTERNYDYGQYADNRDFTYQQDRDTAADEKWQKEFDEAIKQFLALNPDARAYYETYGQEGTTTPSTGSSGGTSVITVGGGGSSSSKNSSSGSKSTSQIAQEVLNGKWGNGADRKAALEAAGYDYATVQAAVNKLVGSSGSGSGRGRGSGSGSGSGSGGGSGSGSGSKNNNSPTITEKEMDIFVREVLDNATSSQFNPQDVIQKNSNLTAEEKRIALELAKTYIQLGYMRP